MLAYVAAAIDPPAIPVEVNPIADNAPYPDAIRIAGMAPIPTPLAKCL